MDPKLPLARLRSVAAAVCVVLALTLAGCSSAFFRPTREEAVNPEIEKIPHEDVAFPSGDGVTLHGRILQPSEPAKGTILFFHGNAENLSSHLPAVLFLVKEGYRVFTFDYRGYGKSEGTPDIPGVNRDGIAALDRVFRIPGVEPGKVAVFGQSLGGAVAVYATANSPRKADIAAVIVEGAFAGYRRIVRDKVASLVVTWPFSRPASWTVEDGYSPERWIGTIAPIPVIVIHGTKDPVVPYEHGKLLYETAKDPKGFWTIKGGGHITSLANPEVRGQFLAFLSSTFSRRKP